MEKDISPPSSAPSTSKASPPSLPAHVESYGQWKHFAMELDELLGNKKWKDVNADKDYDYEMIEERINTLRELEDSNDHAAMVWNLRSELHRNIASICNPPLYERCNVGTKNLIEQYLLQVSKLVITIRNSTQIPPYEKYLFFRDTSYSYGKTSLVLSGGGTLASYHLGVIKALFQNNLLPRIISGSSAGSLVAAIICSRKDEEIEALFANPASIQLDAFERLDNAFVPSLWRKLKRFFRTGVLMDINTVSIARCNFSVNC